MRGVATIVFLWVSMSVWAKPLITLANSKNISEITVECCSCNNGVDTVRRDTTKNANVESDEVISPGKKKSLVKEYQSKLSAFSEAYKTYVQQHKGDDSECLYLINGTPVNKKEKITKLRSLQADDIKSVSLLVEASMFFQPVVAIILKSK